MARAPKKKRTFHQELVLNRWMLSHFHGDGLMTLKSRLGEDRHEGIDDDGQTKFFHELTRSLFNMDRINEADLRRYDLNIVGHWQKITHRRNAATGEVLTMKYFQYLSLLFTEIYLDWYFNHRQDLLDGLNQQMTAYRAEDGAEPFKDYTAEDLNKLAFWNATGSGKTLILHINILQYLHYFQAGNPNLFPDRIILLTPNEGLSRQHLDEFHQSGINAHAFDKNQAGSLFKGWVDVIEVTKLANEMGDKTVSTEAFEGNNLVLVDEGHRGTGSAGGVWMARRAALVKGGFAFEYSATFSQSVAKGSTVAKAEDDILKAKARRLFDKTLKQLDSTERAQLQLTTEERARARIDGIREAYAKAVLIDYSYKYFYADGYGKESLILNLDDKGYDKDGDLYFTACLLSFYQQLWLWDSHRDKIRDFNIEKPLWVFVGNTVAGEDSDILEVIRFLAWFLNHPKEATTWIADLVADKARLLDSKGNDIFAKRFTPLIQRDALTIYDDILKRLFNADARQRLKLVNLRNSKGELALRVGAFDPFGLINIGDDSGFFKNAEDSTDFDTEADDFGTGLFGTINNKDSKLNVLIGSRKFTEGWSSWRVSTMGLLNMGQGEGSQIIQLFGRGVRLKGRGMSLKRSLPAERPKGTHMERLETLNIFGVRANYMATFKDYLKEEGITPSDEIIALDFPTKTNLPSGTRLKTLKLKDGYKDNQIKGFKRIHFPTLYEIPAEFAGKVKPPHVVLDLYPRVEALSTTAVKESSAPDKRYRGKLSKKAIACFDWDTVFNAVQEYKLLKSWSNLKVDRNRLAEFCLGNDGWYTLFVPQEELKVEGFADVQRQQKVMVQLLTDYTDRFYQGLKAAYEGQFYDVAPVVEDSGSIIKLYQFEIENTDDGLEYKERLEVLRGIVESGKLGEASKWNAPHMVAISFGQHLYYPLLSPIKDAIVPLKMRPLAIGDPSEVRFVQDLEAFYESPAGKEALGGLSLYLLRNADNRAKGLGFALAGNFYPDFLLWLVDDESGKQWLSFVDPKGIRNLNLSDPKFGLYREIKQIEAQLADKAISLSAFILSITSFHDLINLPRTTTKSDLEERNVLFMDDGGPSYLRQLITKARA
ncbi:DEAD/DEAH box helicase family protein [Aquidulcibacter sp.]|uniref:DEAD/DEAH box helicase family protein n=1 Tax=Aquidulcibacter sp. TaxID=2052990 RepID=UPI0025B9CBBF|nr:DEAD/DEAH box helicase family protein [Aquidulcibacter sp.]MCA3435449.1 DEAD/DEAH box helicase family protein [Roseomonas sp.]MCA3693300.1 DEAD/DEAH box helicase family protein [Aquidulcibacter sp.]